MEQAGRRARIKTQIDIRKNTPRGLAGNLAVIIRFLCSLSPANKVRDVTVTLENIKHFLE
ncbi:hypothetical protein SBDP2_530008 [Syntrophobacter sp. SbD2]|nr:hypothetical protein SBDP2_530008 [Syntrophobacter sp. SbD2]